MPSRKPAQMAEEHPHPVSERYGGGMWAFSEGAGRRATLYFTLRAVDANPR
jgi:hypothetical protein